MSLIARYRHCLPLPPQAPTLSLGEGGTPLVELIHQSLPDGIRLLVKVEGANPTASFKDRGMVVAISAAAAQGARCVVCASTGNTSASAAAFAARAEMTCVVLIPEGKVATGKIAQAVAHGAEIVQVRGNFDDAMAAVKNIQDDNIAIVNSINPYRLQGQKTAAFEIIADLGDAPDYHALPVGNAGNITAHWIGYCEATGGSTAACSFCGGNCQLSGHNNMTNKRPVLIGCQAKNAAPFLRNAPVDNPDTIATAIRIGNPQSFTAAKIALQESAGWVNAISDEELLRTQKMLASTEGVFCEPASAASVAGALADIANGKILPPARVVCTLTGHGLKDPEIIGAPNVRVVDADMATLKQAVMDLSRTRQ